MRVVDLEPMIDQCPSSASYQKPLGVVLHYADGRRKRYTDFGVARCADMTQRQRKYIDRLEESCRR